MILFVTGAGLSAPSGIPTYRETYGECWVNLKEMDLMDGKNLSDKHIYELIRASLRNWKDQVAPKVPNDGHKAIQELLEAYGGLVLTQNVDDLQEKAGTPPELIVHLHGSLFSNRDDDPLFPDVVLFNEETKDVSVTQAELLERCKLTVIVGSTMMVSTPYPYIDFDKPIIYCDLGKPPFEVTHHIEGDFSQTHRELTKLIKEHYALYLR